MSERKTLDLGYGAGLVVEELAKISLRQKGKKQDKENLNKEMQKIAIQALDSYIPSPELGINPSKVAKSIQKIIAPEFYGTSALLRAKVKDDAGMTEIKAAITNLVYAILKHFYGFNVKSTPAKISDFEYPSQKSEVDIRMVEMNRIIRVIIFTYVYRSLVPLLMISRTDFQRGIISMGIDKFPLKDLMNEMKYYTIIKHFKSVFDNFFKQADFKTLLSKIKFFKD